MKNNKRLDDFSYLFEKKEEPKSDEVSPLAMKSIFFIFTLFLLLFPHYAPYGNPPVQNPSILQNIFNLYFFISNQTFGIVHEGGHGVCYLLPCPQFLTVINGTIFQIMFPLGIAYYYKKKHNYLVMWIGVYFAGFTMHNTAWYISTAHEGAILPAHKSFLGVDAYHDFHYILNTLGVLKYDGVIASFVRVIAYGLMVVAVWKIYLLAFTSKNKETKSTRRVRSRRKR
ncbi:MAG: hypothetical protein U9R27_10515 [Campylobacterota bacterium]|nr:hypothetical protein [Campylobacterota bacterium]